MARASARARRAFASGCSGRRYSCRASAAAPTAGASAPEDVVQECIEYLQQNFGATILEETVREENVHFPLPPNLRISRGANETITLSWPDDGTELMLEKQVPPNANWNFVALPSKDSTGTFSVIDVRSGDSAFYRLRRAQ